MRVTFYAAAIIASAQAIQIQEEEDLDWGKVLESLKRIATNPKVVACAKKNLSGVVQRVLGLVDTEDIDFDQLTDEEILLIQLADEEEWGWGNVMSAVKSVGSHVASFAKSALSKIGNAGLAQLKSKAFTDCLKTIGGAAIAELRRQIGFLEVEDISLEEVMEEIDFDSLM